MQTINQFNTLAGRLQKLLALHSSPVAMKVLYEESEVPEDSLRPQRDLGGHLAMCQAFGMVRREKKALTMLKEDHWCVWPLVSYGLVDLDADDFDYMGHKLFFADQEKGVEFLRNSYPRLQTDRRPIGFTLSPLETAPFIPDLISIYCLPSQLRTIMMGVRYETGEMLQVSFDSVDSCVHSTIPVMNGKPYNITIPDPGDFERGLAREDEMIFTLRGDRLEGLTETMESLASRGFGYQNMAYKLTLDHPRPKFYNDMFRKWGLDEDGVWGE